MASNDAYKETIAGDQPPIFLIEQDNIASSNIYIRVNGQNTLTQNPGY